MTAPRALWLLPAALAAVALAGCGLGAGAKEQGGGVQLRITRDFGEHRLAARSAAGVREGQTVMRFLQSATRVKTRYGGAFVQSIDGLSGGGSGGDSDWFFYVNGVAADRSAADYDLNPGDVVQWDYRYWRAAQDVRATVGAFPEPFAHGQGGKRFPVRVECEAPGAAPCRRVKDALRAQGVPASGAALGTQGNQNVARVVVARWARARQLPSIRAIEQGPRRSGVFARYSAGALQLLDERGRPARTRGADTGLVAALRPTDKELVWVVTGGSGAGVANAARAFRAAALRDAFAVAAGPGGTTTKVPVGAAR